MTPAVRFVKRSIDIAGALAGIAISLPLALPIVAAIVIESGGPVLYVQRRAGKLVEDAGGGKRWVEFDMYKFRTMRADAEKTTGAVLATKEDPRITRVGRFLRKARLDELPQLWNVLKGDMSIVGPRPERPQLLENLALAIPYFEERTRDIKPGITGLAQVNLGYSGAALAGSEVDKMRASLTNPFHLDDAEGALADDMRLKLLFDLAYAAALEGLGTYLSTELSIIVRTPLVMLLARGY